MIPFQSHKTAPVTCLHISAFELKLDPTLEGHLRLRLLIDGKLRCEEQMNQTTSLQFRPLASVAPFRQGSQLTIELLHKRGWWKTPSVLSTEVTFDAAIVELKTLNDRLLRERLGVCLTLQLINGNLSHSLKASINPGSNRPSVQIRAIGATLEIDSPACSVHLVVGGVKDSNLSHKFSRTHRWELPSPLTVQGSQSLAVQITRRNRIKFWSGLECVDDVSIAYSDLVSALKRTTSPNKSHHHKIDGIITVLLTVVNNSNSWKVMQPDSRFQTSDNVQAVAEEALTAARNKTYILDRLGVSRQQLNQLLQFSTALSEIHPIAKTVVGCCGQIYRALDAERRCDQQLIDLAQDIVDALNCVTDVQQFSEPDGAHSQSLETAITGLEKLVVAASNAILGSKSGKLVEREERIADLRSKFRKFMAGFRQRTQALSAVQLEQAMYEFMCLRYRTIFENLMPRGSKFAFPSPCLPGTQTDVLEKIASWAPDLTAPNILWLTGFPGSGKTSIAATLVSARSSCPHFFFRNDDPLHSTTSALWFTIAANLSRAHPIFGKFAVENIEKDKALISPEIFTHLISDPMRRMGTTVEKLPRLIVVDAVDECVRTDDDKELKALLSSLVQWARLPPQFKLLITSRNDELIAQALQPNDPISRHIQLDLRGDSASKDIHLFLEAGFRQIVARYPRTLARQQWPPPGVIEELTNRAGGLFIWAKTLLRFLQQDTEKRLARILKGDMGKEGPIVDLYRKILELSFFQTPEKPDTVDIQTALGAIILSTSPLSFQVYVDCVMPTLEVPGSTFDDICRRLRPVLDNDDVVRFHHKSFADFLLSPSCPSDLRIDLQEQRIKTTSAYLRVLLARLCFNICKLDSSYILNEDVPDLPQRIKQHVPDTLSHASIRWADHLPAIHSDSTITKHIHALLKTHFFYWLEVCSLTHRMDECMGQLSILKDWVANDEELAALAEDAFNFVEKSKDVISSSVPHIYLSVLPFTPPTSKIFEIYHPRFSGSVSVRRMPTLAGGMKHSHPITCVAFSPQGGIASASLDKTIRLWASDGLPMREPLTGHKRTVTCIAFSPNGERLVSGSRDHTAIVWDISTGTPLAKFEKHTDIVTGVVFCGSYRIASVSYDKTIRIWSSTAEREYTDQKEFFSSPLTSVASLGAHKLAVSSADGMIFTMRIKFSRGGASQGHGSSAHEGISRESSVTCIASSPDGVWLITGDKEGTVSKRDIWSGRDVRTMRGHSDRVTTVAASTYQIASGSRDGTIRIWDIDSGELVLGPLRTHCPIISLAFSPNGTQVISTSEDISLRLWELRKDYPKARSALFADNCELKDSWICNPEGQLIVWVPPEHHKSLLWPRNRANFGKASIGLDFTNAKLWNDCRMS
ncbi:hypothetical protein FB451DRAFT_1126752 [Mycena latifolia]|nr:hypothetical protein FB451DRAFT_1126752 [Mycena latifolia]